MIYGAIYICENYEFEKYKIHAYYNNSIPFTSITMKEDLYDYCELQVTPISFSSLKNIEKSKYKMGEPILCNCFTSNQKNDRVRFVTKRKYYKVKNVDVKNFIKLIKENTIGEG